MRITLFAAGSRGDIQPGIVLGARLAQAGYQIRLAAPENFAAMVQQMNLPFHPLRGDVQAIMAGDTGRKYMESGGANPIQSILAMRKLIGPIARQMAEDGLAACRDADAVICLGVFAPLGQTFADICRLPLLLAEPTPLLPTRHFPAAGWPVQRNLGGWHNHFSGAAMLRIIWQWYGPFVNEFRRDFQLPPLVAADFQRILTAVPLLAAYSPTIIPHPHDWSHRVHITGYWFHDDWQTWHPSPELVQFLDRGEPPIYVGFGSMASRDPERLTKIVLEALAQSKQRGVLATGWGGIQAINVPDDVFVLESAPHGWLFPRMAAVVHHGGAGTTAEGLRAGVPTTIVPFIVDQRFWGKRVQALGIGPEPVAAKKLTAAKLAAAIEEMVTDPRMKQRAAAVGQAIQAEDGTGTAVAIIKQTLGA